MAACQTAEQVRLPSLLFSVFIVRGLGCFLKGKAALKLISLLKKLVVEKVPESKQTGEEILCAELLCSSRGQHFGGGEIAHVLLIGHLKSFCSVHKKKTYH